MARNLQPAVAVVLSLAALASANFSIVALGVLAPELQLEFGFSKAEVGFLISLIFMGGALMSYPAGRLTDRVGPAVVLAWALGLFAVAMLAASVSSNIAVFLLLISLGGIAYGGVNPPTNVLVSWGRDRHIGFLLSLKQSGVPLGGIIAGISLPPVVVTFGWRWGLASTALSCMVVATATMLLRSKNSGKTLHSKGTSVRNRFSLARRELVALGIFGFVMSGTQWSIFAYLTLFLIEEHSFGLPVAGLALALTQGFGVIARIVWGWLSDQVGRRLMILGLLSLIAVACLAAMALGAHGLAMWFVLAVIGITVIGWNGAYYALVVDRAGKGSVGRASASAIIFIFAGSVVMPPLFGLVIDVWGSWTPFWILSALLVAFAGFGLRLGFIDESRLRTLVRL